MPHPRTEELNALLHHLTQAPGPEGLVGVVAMLTDREGVCSAGAAGVRELGQAAPMTLVMAAAQKMTPKRRRPKSPAAAWKACAAGPMIIW